MLRRVFFRYLVIETKLTLNTVGWCEASKRFLLCVLPLFIVSSKKLLVGLLPKMFYRSAYCK